MSLLPVDPCSGYQRDSHPLCRPSEGVYFFIEHSITDHQVARDTTICIGNTHGCTCPVTAMEAYIQHSAPCTLLLQKSQALLLHLPAPHRIMWLWPCKLPCTQCVYQCYHRVGLPSKTFQRLDRWQSTAYLIYYGPACPPSWLIHPTPETWLPPSNTWNHHHLPFWGFHLGDTVLGLLPPNQHLGLGHRPTQWGPATPIGPCMLIGMRHNCPTAAVACPMIKGTWPLQWCFDVIILDPQDSELRTTLISNEVNVLKIHHILVLNITC